LNAELSLQISKMEKDGLKAPLDIRANWVKGSKKARRGACSGRAWAVEHNEATP
jgi:hypothetical protein